MCHGWVLFVSEFSPACFANLALMVGSPRSLGNGTRVAFEREAELPKWSKTMNRSSDSTALDDETTDSTKPAGANNYLQCFSARVAQAPAALAASSAVGELSYFDLNARANRLAHYLLTLDVGPEVLVGVCLNRSLELLTAILSVWKSGGAYVPLSPDYPRDRLAYMLSDAQAKVLITERRFLSHFSEPNLMTVTLDNPPFQQGLRPFSTHDPVPQLTPENLAYVIYTSGSTGRPKGVEIPHGALLNHNTAIASVYQLHSEDRVLQFAPISFDVSLEEIFPTWLAGGAVVLRDDDAIASISRFQKFINKQKISVLNLPTAFWHELMSGSDKNPFPATVRLVVIGGDRASPEAYKKWKQIVPPSVTLINAYGPTEATVTSTCWIADRSEETLPIGRPIANTSALLLDDTRRVIAQPGQLGELYLGGAGLARGYRGLPEMTAERFITYAGGSNGNSDRLYRTGDLVRWRADGNLDFVGRADEQVKIRGFRIEPGEVERALLDCPEVMDVAVLAREDGAGRKRLVAYYAPRPERKVSSDQIRRFLESKLPAYMIPSAFVALKALPLSPTGKIDRCALPLQVDVGEVSSYAMLRTSIEEQLASIWRDVLSVKQVGVEDDFFALGGDSLLVMQIFSRVRELLHTELSWTKFFEEPTIAAVARTVEADAQESQARATDSLIPVPRERRLTVSFVQERLWFLQQLQPETDAYNMAFALKLLGHLDTVALETALNLIVRRHEVMRTRLPCDAGELRQEIAPELQVQLEITDFSHMPQRLRKFELYRKLKCAIRKPFDLGRLPLLRANLFRVQGKEHILLMVIHHAISDGWSLRILSEELAEVYRAIAAGQPSPHLPALPLAYADYAAWQRAAFREHGFERDLEYWKQKLSGAPDRIVFPTSQFRIPQPQDAAARACTKVPKRLIHAIERFAQELRATPFIVLVTALALALRDITGQKDLVIGTVVAGRTRQEFEQVLGCFMNFLPLRIQLGQDTPNADVLREVRLTVIESQAHQECPFEKIVTALNPKREQNRNPLYNVALLWHNYPSRHNDWGDLKAESIPLFQQTALLDLRFEAEPSGSEWSIACEYKTALFKEEDIDDLLAHLVHNLKSLASDRKYNRTKPRSALTLFKTWLRRLRTALRHTNIKALAGDPARIPPFHK